MTRNVWYNDLVNYSGIAVIQRCQNKEKNMDHNKKIEISVFGALMISAAIWSLAIATSKLIDSFVSEGEPGSGDWSIDEREYGKY